MRPFIALLGGRFLIGLYSSCDGDHFAHRCDVSDRAFQPRLSGIRRCVRRDAAGRPTRVFGTRAQVAFALLKIALRNTQQSDAIADLQLRAVGHRPDNAIGISRSPLLWRRVGWMRC